MITGYIDTIEQGNNLAPGLINLKTKGLVNGKVIVFH